MIIDWVHATPTILAAFLASLVDFVEALTVVLALGAVRGWRRALAEPDWHSFYLCCSLPCSAVR